MKSVTRARYPKVTSAQRLFARAESRAFSLPAETVQRFATPLERMHHIHGCDSLPATVLGVRDRIGDDVLQEDFQDAPRLLVGQAGDALHAAAACEPTDDGLGDPLEIAWKRGEVGQTFRGGGG